MIIILRPVALLLRLADKDNTLRLVRVEVAPEVVGVQKQKYATAGLIPDPRCLLLANGAREQQA
jgi:hypothetical protein